ncbi:MAG: phosphatidylglycerophosphatase C [Granulosicoccus sp.]|jgi:phosphatidylglycerophosphatase C
MKPELHLFDFDGTITSRDSLLDFASFVVGPKLSKVYLAIVSPVISLMKLGVLKRANAKTMFLKLHFLGMSKTELSKLADEYLEQSKRNDLFRPKALLAIKSAQNSGHTICIVSASLDIWLEPFAKHFDSGLLCTKALFEDEKFTGNLDGKNCNFNEKPRRVQSKYDLSGFSRVVAYGDSKGDEAMFDLADEHHMKPFE